MDTFSSSALFLNKRVAVLTSSLLPDRTALLRSFAPHSSHTRIFLSARRQGLNANVNGWDDLDVVMLKTYRHVYRFDHANGYKDETEIHVPLNIVPQLLRYRSDVVITGEFGPRTLSAIVYRALRPKTKLILWATLSQRTETTRSSLRKLVRRAILRCIDAAFVNGQDGGEYLRQLGFAKPFFFIPYVIDSSEFEGPSLVPDDGVLHLLHAGQLIERKGVYPFFKAFYHWCEQHPERRVSLRIAGVGPERERIESLSVPPNLDIKFLGFLNRQQLAQEYRSASIYIFPTLGDEWGLVVNESLAAGVPVLGSCHGLSSVELVRDGYNGWIFDPSDPSDLMAGMDRAFSTSFEELRNMGENARLSTQAWNTGAIARRMAEAIATIGA